MATRIMQGDSYDLGIEILDEAGKPVVPADVMDVEIVIGHMKKTYAKNEVKYGEDVWLFPLSQEESFRLMASKPKAQVRVKWKSGEVDGTKIDLSSVDESSSKEVL